MSRYTDEQLARHARAAYEAYAKHTGGRTFEGHGMLSWSDLPPRIVEAWIAATKAAIEAGRPVQTPATPHPAIGTSGRVVRTDDDKG